MVYTAQPEQVLAAASLLERHGIGSRIVRGQPMTFPWVVCGLGSHELLVSEPVAERAREQLQSFDSQHVVAAQVIVRTIRWPLLALPLSLMGIVAVGVLGVLGNQVFLFGSLGCCVVLVVSFSYLRSHFRASSSKAAP